MVSYSTCHQKYLHDIYIRASDIDIRASYGHVFVQVNYKYIGTYHTDIGASQGQVFVWLNDINIGAQDINIGDYYIDIGYSQASFGPYNPNLLIALDLLQERSG